MCNQGSISLSPSLSCVLSSLHQQFITSSPSLSLSFLLSLWLVIYWDQNSKSKTDRRQPYIPISKLCNNKNARHFYTIHHHPMYVYERTFKADSPCLIVSWKEFVYFLNVWACLAFFGLSVYKVFPKFGKCLFFFSVLCLYSSSFSSCRYSNFPLNSLFPGTSPSPLILSYRFYFLIVLDCICRALNRDCCLERKTFDSNFNMTWVPKSIV